MKTRRHVSEKQDESNYVGWHGVSKRDTWKNRKESDF